MQAGEESVALLELWSEMSSMMSTQSLISELKNSPGGPTGEAG